MKNKNLPRLAFLFACLLLILSCDKEDETAESTVFQAIEINEVSETEFTIVWSYGNADIQDVRIEISTGNAFESLVYEHETGSASITSHKVVGLNGATKYYCRLIATLADGSTSASATAAQETDFTAETITINTPDGMVLSGKLIYLSYIDDPRPGIIFMHEMGVWVNNWKAADVVKNLVSDGYVCLVFDFRGHGNSTPVPDLGILIEDWSLVATDLTSAIEYLQAQPRVDGTKLALVGASLGGVMAVAGNGFEEVHTSVALSAPRTGIHQLFPDMTLKNVFYIVGENDIHENPNMNFPAEAEHMYNQTEEPRKLTIVPGTSRHGTDLLEMAGVNEAIREWINGSFDE